MEKPLTLVKGKKSAFRTADLRQDYLPYKSCRIYRKQYRFHRLPLRKPALLRLYFTGDPEKGGYYIQTVKIGR